MIILQTLLRQVEAIPKISCTTFKHEKDYTQVILCKQQTNGHKKSTIKAIQGSE